jgi:hypothetical protein
MAKITLGKRPKNFKKTISVQMLDGTTGTVECVFKYRTKKEYGEFIDGITEAARAAEKASETTKAEDAEVKPFSLAEYLEKSVDAGSDYILQILDGWNLDVELSKESVEDLANEFPGAAAAIIETYRIAVTEGRLGN